MAILSSVLVRESWVENTNVVPNVLMLVMTGQDATVAVMESGGAARLKARRRGSPQALIRGTPSVVASPHSAV
jgi:hypothetical protein